MFFIVLRLCKVPPRFEIGLNNRAMNILGLGIMVHIAMNIWVFSNPEIFPE
jgi:cytochrome b subunit of formate dehydrogenase